MPVVLPYPGLILIIQKDCTYKDSVFCRIFNEKKELLSLYNALNMSHYENPDDLEIITLDNALFLQMKNDVAFLINTNEMCLIEHSSTVCLNYPLRSLLYLAREYEVILEQRNENILKYGLVKIPTPAELTLQKGKLTKANLPFWFYAFNTL